MVLDTLLPTYRKLAICALVRHCYFFLFFFFFCRHAALEENKGTLLQLSFGIPYIRNAWFACRGNWNISTFRKMWYDEWSRRILLSFLYFHLEKLKLKIHRIFIHIPIRIYDILFKMFRALIISFLLSFFGKRIISLTKQIRWKMTFARGTWKRCNVQFKRIGSWTKSVKSVYSRVETLNKHGIFTHGIMEGSDSRKSNNRIPVNRKFLFKPPSVYHLFAKNISAKRVRWKKNIEYKKREAGGDDKTNKRYSSDKQ